MTEEEFTMNEQRFLAMFRQAQDYELPPLKRLLTRVVNGVPTIKAGALFRREIVLARAKAHHGAKV